MFEIDKNDFNFKQGLFSHNFSICSFPQKFVQKITVTRIFKMYKYK